MEIRAEHAPDPEAMLRALAIVLDLEPTSTQDDDDLECSSDLLS